MAVINMNEYVAVVEKLLKDSSKTIEAAIAEVRKELKAINAAATAVATGGDNPTKQISYNDSDNDKTSDTSEEESKVEVPLKDTTALVLRGGGAKGAYQMGILRALNENNLLEDVTAISGASIGTINMLLYASNGIKGLEDGWKTMDMFKVLFDVDMDMLKAKNIHFSREEIIELFEAHYDFEKIKNSEIDLWASVTKLDTDEPVYMQLNGCDKQRIIDITLASSALPVLYDSVNIDGVEYVDGGCSDNCPIKPLYDAGYRRFIVINLKTTNEVKRDRFPDAEFIEITPSYDIGDLDGTLDFRKQSIEYRDMLGYKDGLRAYKTKFLKDEMYINLEKVLAENDYNEVRMTMRTNEKIETLTSQVNSNIDKFKAIEDKYNIF